MHPKITPFHKVLVIDDDKASRYLAQIEVAAMQIAQAVVTLNTAQEALEFIEQHCFNEKAAPKDCPDLILLDLNMPGVDGFEFLEALQTLGQSNLIHAQVVILTSSDYFRDQDRASTYGVTSFIQKPLTAHKLRAIAINSVSALPTSRDT